MPSQEQINASECVDTGLSLPGIVYGTDTVIQIYRDMVCTPSFAFT